jgi:dTDP-4-amino-4,6-dideoxygalactose transaminase
MHPPIPLLDLAEVHRRNAGEIEAAVLQVLRSGRYVLGPEVEGFEREAQEYLGSGPALAVSSGTDALLLALMCLDVAAGDEVITTPFTFFATAGTIARAGARPVFVDIDPKTHNIDAEAAARAVTAKTKILMPVHLFGRAAPMERLLQIAKAKNLRVIEDCAQAIGTYVGGVSVGTRSPLAAWSLFPSKNLGVAGDGGFLTINDPALVEKARALRTHGEVRRYHHRWVGGNFRMDAIQCAIARVKLRSLSAETEGRRRNAALYAEAFRAVELDETVALPSPEGETRHSYHQYTVEVPDRDALAEFLGKQQIGCGVYYPVPLHLQECFQSLGYREGSLPHAEAAAKRVLSLPIHSGLTAQQIERVVAAIQQFYRGNK